MVTAAAVLLGSMMCSTSAYAQSAAWTISEASGRVVIRDSAGDHPGARGAAVPAGATVMTGASARAILVRGQDFVTLSANARMRLPDAAKAGGLFQMIQEWGNALFRIEHRRDPHFAVQAPYLAAVVKGTTFSVTVTREGSSVQVIEGAVEAATADGGAHELIRPGAVASVMASDRFRLTVQGQNAHSVDSPARGRAGAGAPAAPPTPNGASTGGGDHNDAGAVDASTSGGTGSYDDIAWQQVANSVVAAPIEAKPADLGKITDGLVSGKSNGTAVASAVAIARAETSGSGNGNGSGGAVSNGNGNGSSAATSIGTSGNGASSGTGNSSGNGNSAGSGNGNSGTGNGASDNGNGDSGNGNGNGGASDSGSGSGNGNGNSGNGNGNGGGDGNNPGNGNTNPGNGNGGGGKPKG